MDTEPNYIIVAYRATAEIWERANSREGESFL